MFIKAYASVPQARSDIGAWLSFYNDERKHQSLGYRTPGEIFAASQACGYVHNASALHTYPQAQQQPQTEKDPIHARNIVASDIDLLAA